MSYDSVEKFCALSGLEIPDGEGCADGILRLQTDFDKSGRDVHQRLDILISELDQDSVIRAIIIDDPTSRRGHAVPSEIVKILLNHLPRLHQLDYLCLAHFVAEDLVDIAELIESLPQLEHLAIEQVMENTGYHFGCPIRHIGLKTLGIIGRLKVNTSTAFLHQSVFSELETLAIWPGPLHFGEPRSFENLLTYPPPKLKHLACFDCYQGDDLAFNLPGSNLIKQIEELTISKSGLTDDGAQKLIDASADTKLKVVNLENHYIDAKLVEKLNQTGYQLNQSRAETEDDNFDYRSAMKRRLDRRIKEHIDCELLVELDCLPHFRPSVLDEVAIKGKVRIIERGWEGDLLDSPTWLDIAIEVNRYLIETEDWHIYLSGIRFNSYGGAEPNVQLWNVLLDS